MACEAASGMIQTGNDPETMTTAKHDSGPLIDVEEDGFFLCRLPALQTKSG